MVFRIALLTSMAVNVVGCGFDTPAPMEELPKVSFAAEKSLTDESVGQQRIVVKLSMKTGDMVTVGWSAVFGPAGDKNADKNDVGTTEGVVTFDPFQDTATFDVSIRNDMMEEDDEDFQLVLKDPKNAELGTQSKHTLTIAKNILPRVRFAAATSSAGEETGTQNFAIQLDTLSPVPVEVKYSVGGTADPDDHGLVDGFVTIPVNEASQLLLVTIANDMVDEYDQTIDVTLIAQSGAIVAPGLGEHVHTIVDDDPPPVVAFATTASTAAEDAGTVNLTVNLGIRSEKEVKVDVNLASGGSAAATDDFTFTPVTLTFPPGTTSLTVPVTIVNDTIDENPETIVFALSNAVNATLQAATQQHTLTITDDDNPPSIQFQQAASTAAEGTATHAVTVELSSKSGLNIQFSITRSGTSTTADLTVPSGPFTIPAGQTTFTLNTTVIDDTDDDDNETAILTLASPSNASLGTQTTHTITITDNDGPPLVRFDTATPDRSANEGNSGTTTYTYRVVLSAASNNTVTVPVAVGGTSMPNDFDLGTGDIPVVFQPGEKTKDIRVIVNGDTMNESDETVTLMLGAPTNATNAADNQLRTHTIKNDD